MKKFFLILAITPLLSGCISLFPKPADPPRIFTLTPKSTFKKELEGVGGLIIVEQLHAGADIDTEKITVHLSPYSVDYYKQARWTERAPKMIQNLIVESFENSRRITAIASDAGKLRSDYLLMAELKEFQSETYHEPNITKVHVAINAKLIKMPERKLIASANFDHVLDAVSTKMEDIVTTFDKATGKSLKKLVHWTIESIRNSKIDKNKS